MAFPWEITFELAAELGIDVISELAALPADPTRECAICGHQGTQHETTRCGVVATTDPRAVVVVALAQD